MYNFEKLKVWQKTREFVNEIYKITDKYPIKEKFLLAQHTRKSSISILSNIAEGGSRLSSVEHKRFIEIALCSLYETIAQLIVTFDNECITKKNFDNLYIKSQEISRMLTGLSRSFK